MATSGVQKITCPDGSCSVTLLCDPSGSCKQTADGKCNQNGCKVTLCCGDYQSSVECGGKQSECCHILVSCDKKASKCNTKISCGNCKLEMKCGQDGKKCDATVDCRKNDTCELQLNCGEGGDKACNVKVSCKKEENGGCNCNVNLSCGKNCGCCDIKMSCGDNDKCC